MCGRCQNPGPSAVYLLKKNGQDAGERELCADCATRTAEVYELTPAVPVAAVESPQGEVPEASAAESTRRGRKAPEAEE